MTEGIIIPDTHTCDAEIWVTENHNPFMVDEEYSTLITVIPFNDNSYIGAEEEGSFHMHVLDVAKSLSRAYEHDTERSISIEIRFHDRYCNA